VSYDVRLLTPGDQAAAWRLGSVAFGYHDRSMPVEWASDTPGRNTWGVFDEAGALVAKAVDREQSHWFGGRIVPASGVAGVAVAPELRGTGLARLVLSHLLATARERGAVISTLFATTATPYRRLGWEEVGALTWRIMTTSALAGVRQAPSITLRAATPEDVPALHEIYRAVARTSSGMIERSAPLYPTSPEEFLNEYDGVSVAVNETADIEGYAAWDRGNGYGADSRVTVADLIGLTPAATDSLLAMFGRWASVAPTLLLRLPDPDPALLVTSSRLAREESRQPWMLRVVDAAGAVAARGWPAHVSGSVDLDLIDEACGWNAGRHRLVLADGKANLEAAAGDGSLLLTERGFGLLYAGAAGPALLRRAGLLTGGDWRTDELLQAAFAGPPPTLLNYF
jgi:predicted acetyltransferase